MIRRLLNWALARVAAPAEVGPDPRLVAMVGEMERDMLELVQERDAAIAAWREHERAHQADRAAISTALARAGASWTNSDLVAAVEDLAAQRDTALARAVPQDLSAATAEDLVVALGARGLDRQALGFVLQAIEAASCPGTRIRARAEEATTDPANTCTHPNPDDDAPLSGDDWVCGNCGAYVDHRRGGGAKSGAAVPCGVPSE
ncbi:MAG: hypothetical protein ACTHU0_21710 [Kofleriaceae bacterium]